MAGNVVLGALRHLWLTLQGMNVPAAVMGGIALSAWEHVRATRDVDLLIGVESGDLDSLLQQLRSAGVRPKREPPTVALGKLRMVQLLYEPPETFVDVQVDLLLADSEYHRGALARSVAMRLPDLDCDVFVLTVEDLVLHKLIAGRIVDRADAATLLRINRDRLDLGYLLAWAASLQVTTELAEIWAEAFPGEQLPATRP
ncbi:MAG: nucleotidyl transferase AbiEii/AbiGii toxin family protein [Planctomycetes bacterium]|nr:nucleotidyl transferase AbiEii/AbiGii toxin family protein [Planctomycetota bacterium]